MNFADCPPGRPSPEQLRAVGAAGARARRLLPDLGDYETRWVCAPGASALAQTQYPIGRPPLVLIRADLPPAECHRVMLHELQHVADEPIILAISHDESERRAEAFVVRALSGERIETIMSNFTEITARRNALVAEVHAICDRAERERRRLTVAERRDADAVLQELAALAKPAPRRASVTAAPSTATMRHWGCSGAGRLRPLPHANALRCDFCWQLFPLPRN